MTLADYYFDDPRLILVPIEHLTPRGVTAEFAVLLAAHGWDRPRVDLFNIAFALYWERTSALASRTRTWAPPRLRHVAVVLEPLTVRPYAQLLNTSAWTLYDCDFDPRLSHPEFAAYLLVHGDRMALTGEVTAAALHNAAYWFERTDAECAAFGAAAAQSCRPDADAFRALAAATAWLPQLFHEDLRPPPPGAAVRAIPGTGLRVPHSLEASPPALTQEWTRVAQRAVAAFQNAWHAPDREAAAHLCDWLSTEAPPLLITGHANRILWDPQTPTRLGSLRSELRQASGAAVRDVTADLHVIDHHTRAFHAALVDPAALPHPHPDTAQSGYSYLHRDRGRIAYNLHEVGIERLQSPALPYARAMLGARTLHEWAHLAVDAGWVPAVIDIADLARSLAEELDATIAAAPRAVQERTAVDLGALQEMASSPGAALAQILQARLPDYQANLLARRFMDLAERETYIRHNIRTLRFEFAPERLWRMLARYLFEYQYLAFSAVLDPQRYFRSSTWFDVDFLGSGILDERRFAALTNTVARLCAAYAVDEARFHTVRAATDKPG
jgi:hypothetical protein